MKKVLTLKQILKLRPEFKFGSYYMVDYFIASEGDGFFSLRSGLNHADGETKPPFFFEEWSMGINAKKTLSKIGSVISAEVKKEFGFLSNMEEIYSLIDEFEITQ